MRILQINKFFYHRGGADSHFLNLSEWLQSVGQQVSYLSTQHPLNLPKVGQSFWPPYLEFSDYHGAGSIGAKIRRMFGDKATKKSLDYIIKSQQPQVAHLHNVYHQLSPRLIGWLKKAGIPVIVTLHDYYPFSPLYTFYAKGQLWDWRHRHYGRIIKQRAIKNSYLASCLAVMAHWLTRHYWQQVDYFICPSHFMAKVLSYYYPQAKYIVMPNAVDASHSKISDKSDYFVFSGRIVSEKGLDWLLKLWRSLPDKKLYILGDGPERKRYQRYYQNLREITWLGQLKPAAAREIVAASKALLVPSQWYENCPLVVQEAIRDGVPVVASDLGGLPELLHSYSAGIVLPSNDQQAWRKVIQDFSLNKADIRENNLITPQEYSDKIYKLYEKVV
ncbi:MAG: glycosyltransferase family 4 protein [Candidatus Komeilibacteria bacterium]